MLCPKQRGMVEAAGAERCPQVLDHFAVGHPVRPRRGAVIAQIKGQNPVARREVLGDRPPIPAGTEEAVQDRNRRP